MDYCFDHERLKVYQDAIAFCAWWEDTAASCRSLPTVKDQIDRASTSIALNIAEGNGKFTARDRCKYLQIAVGSAFECAACLDVLAARGRLQLMSVAEGKQKLRPIVSMLVSLIHNSSDRLRDASAAYSVSDFSADL